MKKKKYPHYLPKGWTLEEVQKVAEYYDHQSDEEGAAEIEALEETETIMFVPTGLVPQVRKLIAGKTSGKSRHNRARRVA
jgi:hypothetical protein